MAGCFLAAGFCISAGLSTVFGVFPLVFSPGACQYVDMVCLYCGSETRVTNSRLQKRNNQVWRRRQCLNCQSVFTTHEAAELSGLLMVSGSGAPKPFSEDILFTEVLLALSDRNDSYSAAREVTATIVRQLLKLPESPVFKPKQISHVAGGVLKRLDRQAWMRYAAEHPSLQP